MQDEKKFVADLLKGKKRAEKEFYQQYQERLKNFILGKVADPRDAEEILQDSFISFFVSLPNFNFNSSLYSYLCAITKHEVVDFYRKKKIKMVLFSRFPFLETLAAKALTPEEEVLKQELKTEIKKTLKSIGRRYGKLLRLKYLLGFSVKEIAQKTASSPKSVESALTRARKSFANEYRRKKEVRHD